MLRVGRIFRKLLFSGYNLDTDRDRSGTSVVSGEARRPRSEGKTEAGAVFYLKRIRSLAGRRENVDWWIAFARAEREYLLANPRQINARWKPAGDDEVPGDPRTLELRAAGGGSAA